MQTHIDWFEIDLKGSGIIHPKTRTKCVAKPEKYIHTQPKQIASLLCCTIWWLLRRFCCGWISLFSSPFVSIYVASKYSALAVQHERESCLSREFANAYDQSWRQPHSAIGRKTTIVIWKKRDSESHSITFNSIYSPHIVYPSCLLFAHSLRWFSVFHSSFQIYAQFMRNAKRNKNHKSKTNICTWSYWQEGGRAARGAIPSTEWWQRDSNTNIGDLLHVDKLTRSKNVGK